jgi:hypothetical protein
MRVFFLPLIEVQLSFLFPGPFPSLPNFICPPPPSPKSPCPQDSALQRAVTFDTNIPTSLFREGEILVNFPISRGISASFNSSSRLLQMIYNSTGPSVLTLADPIHSISSLTNRARTIQSIVNVNPLSGCTVDNPETNILRILETRPSTSRTCSVPGKEIGCITARLSQRKPGTLNFSM